MADELQLKPCPNPWCGNSRPAIYQGGWRNRFYRIQCETCGMTPGKTSEFQSEAIAAWNTRSPPPPSSEVVVTEKMVEAGAHALNDSPTCESFFTFHPWCGTARAVIEAALYAAPPALAVGET